MVPLDNGHVTSKEYSSKNVNSRFYVGTSDFSPEIQEKLVPKTFSSRCMVPLHNVTEYTVTSDADRWRCSGFFESFFFYIFERL
jgi:hypothetical protein